MSEQIRVSHRVAARSEATAVKAAAMVNDYVARNFVATVERRRSGPGDPTIVTLRPVPRYRLLPPRKDRKPWPSATITRTPDDPWTDVEWYATPDMRDYVRRAMVADVNWTKDFARRAEQVYEALERIGAPRVESHKF